MSPDLEQWYADLLRLYPKAYREERAGEMLATVVEAERPVVRETAALILGALRARAGLAGLTSPGQWWLSALRLTVLVLVAHATALAGAKAGRIVFSDLLQGRGLALPSDLGHVGAFVTGGLALLAFAAARYLSGILLAAATFVLTLWALSWYPTFMFTLVDGEFWPLPLAMLLAVPLLLWPPRPAARPVWWLLAVPVALLVLPTAFDASLGWQPYALLALGVVALLWTVVDARVAIAAGGLFVVQVLTLISFWTPGWSSHPVGPFLLIYTGYAAVLVAAGYAGIRRQADL
ncbi:hypothetical protein ACIA5D_06590 [Actinoplanes sp. NPDC051513]|uniref:hypothetical protein n=1 Tax=Actinoplanes sp. NPDC051513 TaxID=3363908 RepID=UPI00379E329A